MVVLVVWGQRFQGFLIRGDFFSRLLQIHRIFNETWEGKVWGGVEEMMYVPHNGKEEVGDSVM